MTAPFKPALQPGQTIGVMAPSSYVEQDDIGKAADIVQDRGYRVFIHPQTFEHNNQSAGTLLQKSMALQGLWQRADIDTVWFAGGGNQALDLLGSLNFETMKRNEKTALGFSDTTSLLNAITYHTGFGTWHAPVLKSLTRLSATQLDTCFAYLEGAERSVSYDQGRILKGGKATGPLVGGNLSIAQYLPSLLGERFYDGAILFLEDCNEELSRIDRMFSYLRTFGVFDKISGLVLGQFSDLTDTGRPFKASLDDIVTNHTEGYSFPILKNLSFGHSFDAGFAPLPIGVTANIDTDEGHFFW